MSAPRPAPPALTSFLARLATWLPPNRCQCFFAIQRSAASRSNLPSASVGMPADTYCETRPRVMPISAANADLEPVREKVEFGEAFVIVSPALLLRRRADVES